jgi:hypothetical protein
MSSLYRSILNAQGSSFASINSFEFDGSTDFISIADNNNLSFGNGTSDSPFSISAWVKCNSGDIVQIANKWSASNNLEYQFVKTPSDKILFRTFDGSDLVRRGRETSVLTTQLNDWFHVCATYNGVGGTNADLGMKIYVNGTRLDNASANKNTYTAMHNTSAHFRVGNYSTSYGVGKVDELAIFNAELSSTDVTAIYNSGVPNNLNDLSNPPISWWRMGEAANYSGGQWTLTDQGSGGNDGTSTTIPAPPAQPSTDVPT